MLPVIGVISPPSPGPSHRAGPGFGSELLFSHSHSEDLLLCIQVWIFQILGSRFSKEGRQWPLGFHITTLTFLKQERSQGHCSTAPLLWGLEGLAKAGKGADRMAGDFPRVSTCPVLYTLIRRYIKHLLNGWVSHVHVSGVLGAGGGNKGIWSVKWKLPTARPRASGIEVGGGSWEGLLGPLALPPLPYLPNIVPLQGPAVAVQRITTGIGSQNGEGQQGKRPQRSGAMVPKDAATTHWDR